MRILKCLPILYNSKCGMITFVQDIYQRDRKEPFYNKLAETENSLIKEMILRDHLAVDRTIMANERSLLSYARTMLASVAGGITIIKLFGADSDMKILGIVLISFGIVSLIVGIYRYRIYSAKLGNVKIPNYNESRAK